MPLAPGARLGPYEIVAPLGAGGMGEVYRARDSRLKREVALKVLRTHGGGGGGASDAALLRRLEQEARTIAALNHPNLVAIHDVGEHDGAPFLVMELLEGETLRARLHAQGALPLRRALDIARQLAQGLAAAHAAGVVHRDLKPENIMLTPAGRVKILDFGLAKAAEAVAVAAEADTLAETSPALVTQAGAVMGTVGYMAPEQVRGDKAGPETDIFAFGAILYEMVAGQRAFQAETSAEIMTAILRAEPPELAPGRKGGAAVPPALDRILRRCLEKAPAMRFQSAADLDFALGAIAEASSTSFGTAPPVARARQWRRRWRTPLAIAATAAASVAVSALFMLDRGWPTLPANAFQVLSTTAPGAAQLPQWSPSGDAIAFSASPSPGATRQVFLYRLGSPAPVALTHASRDASPLAWSADGRSLIFSQDQFVAPSIWSVAAVGGEPQKLADLGHPVGGAQGLTAHGDALAAIMPQPDGKLGVAYTTHWGEPVRWYAPAPFAVAGLSDFPALAFSDDGHSLLLEMPDAQGPNRTWVLPFPPNAAQPPRPAFANLPERDFIRISWLPHSDHILIAAGKLEGGSSLWDGDTGSGHLTRISGDIPGAYIATLSPGGNALAFTRAFQDFQVVSASVVDATVTPLVASVHKASMPAWAQDAPVLVYTTDRDGVDEIWMHTASDGGASERRLMGPERMGRAGIYVDPALSPHAHRIAFTFAPTVRGSESQPQRMWLAAVAGGPPVPLTTPGSDFQVFPAWSPDGNHIAYLSTAGPTASLALVATSGDAAPRVLVPQVASDTQSDTGPAWSRDGKWIAYPAADGLVHLIAPDGSADHLLTRTPLAAWTFSADSRFLYGSVVHGQTADLVEVALATGAVRTIGNLGDHVPRSWELPGIHMTLAPDGRSVAYNAGASENDLDLVQPFHPYGTGMARLRHWLHLP